MDKVRFIEVAPQYYAIAIVNILMRNSSIMTLEGVASAYAVTDEQTGVELYSLIRRGPLLDAAVAWLERNDLVSLVHDDFGPTLIGPAPTFGDRWGKLILKPGTVFHRYTVASSTQKEWLRVALDNILNEYERLAIQPEDFARPEGDWEPIPLDREKPELAAAIKAVDDAIEAVRADNGYSAERPEERAYVLDSLMALGRRLKDSAAISMPYIQRFAVEPLARAAKTLGKSVAGIVVEVAKDRLKAWLMRLGIPSPFDW